MWNIWSIVRNLPKWKSERPFNQTGFFFSWMEWRPRTGWTSRVGNQSRATSGKEQPSWFFLQLEGVKIKDRSNWSCGEPESCYFNKSGEKGTVELAVWGTKVVLLQDVHHRIAHPRGIPSKAVKLRKESGQMDKSSRVQLCRKRLFLGSSQKKDQVFWRLT